MSEELKPTVREAPKDEFRRTLGAMKSELEKALPSHVPVDRFTRVVMTAVQMNPDLLSANRHSLFQACTRAAQDGLLPDGREAALVTYNLRGVPTVQYMPMIAGILKKVRNSGDLSTINSQVVYQKDAFDYWIDESGEHLNHKPNLIGARGDRLLAYALARTKDGGIYVEVMSADQVMAVKNVSRAKDRGPWAGDFEDEMWRKTVIRRLAKRLPMSTDLESVIHADDDLYDLNQRPDEKQQVTGPKRSRLAAIVEAHVTAPELPESPATENEAGV